MSSSSLCVASAPGPPAPTHLPESLPSLVGRAFQVGPKYETPAATDGPQHHGPCFVLTWAALFISPLYLVSRYHGRHGHSVTVPSFCGGSRRHRKEQTACEEKQAGTWRQPEAESRDPCRVIQQALTALHTRRDLHKSPILEMFGATYEVCPPTVVSRAHVGARGLGGHHLRWIIAPTPSGRDQRTGYGVRDRSRRPRGQRILGPENFSVLRVLVMAVSHRPTLPIELKY